MTTRLFLASASPRRAQLLQTLGLPFTLAASAFVEPPPTPEDDAAPAQYVERLARAKAAAATLPGGEAAEGQATDGEAAAAFDDGALVLAADTVVWHREKILGKPRDATHARAMLLELRGQTHQVFTGICLRRGDEYLVAHEATAVRFGWLSDAWIVRYAESGEPLDKAGAYAAQGRGALLIERIEGDFWNVVGLPLATLGRLLETVGAPVEEWW